MRASDGKAVIAWRNLKDQYCEVRATGEKSPGGPVALLCFDH
jgi:hypothetical protein